jgi:hypothetical protein
MLFLRPPGHIASGHFATICFGGAGGNNSLQKSASQVPEQLQLVGLSPRQAAKLNNWWRRVTGLQSFMTPSPTGC